MKQIFLICMLVLTASSSSSQEINDKELLLFPIGEFKSRDQMFKADAYVSNDTTIVYMYRLEATHTVPTNFYDGYSPKIYILCTPTMKKEFLEIDSIYKKWTEIAEKNEVGKIEKEIEVDIPSIGYFSLHKKTGVPDRYFECKNHHFIFKIFDEKKTPSIFCNNEFKDDGTGITIHTGLAFQSPKEFDAFVEFIDPMNTIKKIKQGEFSLFSHGKAIEAQKVTMPIFQIKTTNSAESQRLRVPSQDKGAKRKIAQGALNRWLNNAQKASGIK